MIWIDSSVPKPVQRAIRSVRDDVEWIGDLYPFDQNKDAIWLPDAGKAGALVILRDKKVRTRPGERRLIIEHQVGCFVLTQKRNPTRWEYLRLIVRTLDEMEEKFASTPRPFIYTVDSLAAFHLYYPRPPVTRVGAQSAQA